MEVQDKHHRVSFASVSGKPVEAVFDGGVLTSDIGLMLLREVESKIGILSRIVEALTDRRHPSYVDHTCADLINQRVFQIACGYEDANDCNALRRDPAFKAACDRLPVSGAALASQPTMSRLENGIRRRDLYRIAKALVDGFIASYDTPPEAVVLDIDDTDDEVHGDQPLSLFNGYYDERCYMPLHIYEGQTGRLITTLLRPGARPSGETDCQHSQTTCENPSSGLAGRGHLFAWRFPFFLVLRSTTFATSTRCILRWDRPEIRGLQHGDTP